MKKIKKEKKETIDPFASYSVNDCLLIKDSTKKHKNYIGKIITKGKNKIKVEVFIFIDETKQPKTEKFRSLTNEVFKTTEEEEIKDPSLIIKKVGLYTMEE